MAALFQRVRRRKDAFKAREISRQRIEMLFSLADEEYGTHTERSDRYVGIARRICTRMRIRMPRHLKAKFCKHCGSYLPPSARRVRLKDGIITETCLRCGRQLRRPYSPADSKRSPVPGSPVS
jgi:ribonuclease P protein subunit RPR2